MFSRLRALAETTLCTVAEMHHLGWDEGREAWKWRRRLFAWKEDLLRKCCFLLHNIVLKAGVLDRWIFHTFDPCKYFLSHFDLCAKYCWDVATSWQSTSTCSCDYFVEYLETPQQ